MSSVGLLVLGIHPSVNKPSPTTRKPTWGIRLMVQPQIKSGKYQLRFVHSLSHDLQWVLAPSKRWVFSPDFLERFPPHFLLLWFFKSVN